MREKCTSEWERQARQTDSDDVRSTSAKIASRKQYTSAEKCNEFQMNCNLFGARIYGDEAETSTLK